MHLHVLLEVAGYVESLLTWQRERVCVSEKTCERVCGGERMCVEVRGHARECKWTRERVRESVHWRNVNQRSGPPKKTT